MRLRMIPLGAIVLLAIGCQNEKIANLEKQNQELKAEVEKSHAAGDLDLQAKCSEAAKTWFKENWSMEKNTTFLNFENHYSKSQNKCFISVEYHYAFGANGSWMGDINLWDVYENSKYGSFSEYHMISFKPKAETKDSLYKCQLLEKKCTSVEEYKNLVAAYLND